MKLIYVHGGECFDTLFEGWRSTALAYLEKPFKTKPKKWADNLAEDLPEFEVIKMQMPWKYDAKYVLWEKYFQSQMDNISGEAVLLGWSLGANFLAKYLAKNDVDLEVVSLHLVAAPFGAPGGFDFQGTLAPVETKTDNIYLYHSKDDFVVPYQELECYQKALKSAQTMTFEDRNHFLQDKFPELISNIRGMQV